MRAIAQDQFGGPEVLRLSDLPVPKPGPNEILIQVAYASINPFDCKLRAGHFRDFLPTQFPLVPGVDLSGIVIGTGEGASLFKNGDKVYAFVHKPVFQWGTYAEFIAIDERQAARIPKHFGFKDAAAIPLAALTARQALFDQGALERGQTVLILGGAGGVGTYAVQLAKNAGAGVLATASLRNHELVRSLGADGVIDYAREDVVALTRSTAAQGVDVIIDLVGGPHQATMAQALKKNGRYVSVAHPPADTLRALPNLTALAHATKPDSAQLAEMAPQFDEGRLKMPPVREYDLRDAAAAQALLETGHIQGKIVLKVK